MTHTRLSTSLAAALLLSVGACEPEPDPRVAPRPPATDGTDPTGDYQGLERETVEPYPNVAGTEDAPPYSRNNPQAVEDERMPPVEDEDTPSPPGTRDPNAD